MDNLQFASEQYKIRKQKIPTLLADFCIIKKQLKQLNKERDAQIKLLKKMTIKRDNLKEELNKLRYVLEKNQKEMETTKKIYKDLLHNKGENNE